MVVDPNEVIKERLTEAAGLMMRKDGYRRPVADVLAEEIRFACREMFA